MDLGLKLVQSVFTAIIVIIVFGIVIFILFRLIMRAIKM